jgi:hypothetical protein
MDAVIFGNNKKRRRDEFHSDLDDDSKRKMRMREERLQQLKMMNENGELEGEEMIDLREIRKKQLQSAANEEELSDDEIQKQVDNDELYMLKKAMQSHDLERYNTLKQKEVKDEEKLEEMILDLNQEKKAKNG